MSLIKNAYVCIVNGVPELFETEDQALELAAEISSDWYEAGADMTAIPKIVVMSVVQYLKAQEHLAQLAC